ncbi:MAG TPA: acetyl-CoA carboxylase biotin carboxylase subunit [Bradyrhizobium sp.]|nr:acetyl-CoA carboxylase biotin carboxylase subunit [Bradyrhizobium sp.]
MKFRTVLIANRGEIALRIIRACKRLGLRTVAVHSEADRGAMYLEMADKAVCIGPPPPGQSYLDAGAILLAAGASGAEAIHPGYGFLSENGDFAEAVEQAGMTLIGPSAAVMRLMGDKIAAKEAMKKVGIPCVPGSDGALPPDQSQCDAIARDVGYPVIVKAAGGGGGRGICVVRSPSELAAAIVTTRAVAAKSFGNPDLYIEKFLEHPRHIEIQVLCDDFGRYLWLGERDCSVQRRHQKVIEEAPAAGIPREAIAALGERCTAACLAIGYRGVGTFEFLYENGVFAFIEMNTRVQVEHPVTEAITGIDIVCEQIRVAGGLPLSINQSDIVFNGHAIECRINAEDPFLSMPSPGSVLNWHSPLGPGLRVDTHMRSGASVPSHYDSLVAKLIVWGHDRPECVKRLKQALDELRVDGISINRELHKIVLNDPQFERGEVNIHFLEKLLREREPRRVGMMEESA